MNFREHIRTFATGAPSVLEIGPSYNPITPRKDGFRVTIFDHMSRADLIEKYRGHPVDPARIEEVDVVGTDLSALNGRKFACIIASHLIEHTTDFIDFLKRSSELLDEGGKLFLIVPDKRYCFDRLRPVTTTGQILDAHLGKKQRHFGAVFDQFAWAVSRDGQITWAEGASSPMKHVHTFEEAHQAFKTALESESYTDAHEWVFTPSSFRLICHDLAKLGYSHFGEELFHESVGCEFFLVLTKGAKQLPDRAQVVARMKLELGAEDPSPTDVLVQTLSKEVTTLRNELEEMKGLRIPGEQRARRLLSRLLRRR